MRIRADPDPDQKNSMKWNYPSICAKVMDRGGAGVKYLYLRYATLICYNCFQLKKEVIIFSLVVFLNTLEKCVHLLEF